VRDSFAASESVELAPNGVADFHRNGWPACLGMGGRIASEWAADFRRNGWPACLGMGGRIGSDYGRQVRRDGAPVVSSGAYGVGSVRADRR
jgi:hypothetical protein